MSALTLAELTYEQAQSALEQQERQVNELRQRTGTLLAATALTASFFGVAALSRDGVGIPVVLAGIALAVTVLSGLYALYPHELKFASDARRLYDRFAPDRDDPERLYLRLAFGLRDAREENGASIGVHPRDARSEPAATGVGSRTGAASSGTACPRERSPLRR